MDVQFLKSLKDTFRHYRLSFQILNLIKINLMSQVLNHFFLFLLHLFPSFLKFINVLVLLERVPRQYWTDETIKDFFESYARKRGLNPFIAETWYKISWANMLRTKV